MRLMPAVVCATVSLLVGPGLLAAPPTGAEAVALLGQTVPAAIGAYQDWEALHRDGRGHSEAKTSGALAWGESSWLCNYLSCYVATRDRYWLDKLVDHFDRMLANQHEQDGFRVWDDTRYSAAIVKVVTPPAADGPSLTPPEQREWATRFGDQVTGHRYRVEFTTADRVRVVDQTTGQPAMAPTAYAGELVLDVFSGRSWRTAAEARAAKACCPLTLKGAGRAGVGFDIETVAVEPIQFVVHDGMIAYPVARFIAAVCTDPSLKADYGAAADRYLAWFDRHVYQKWSRHWRQVDAATGAYQFTAGRTERYPGYLLPHNQYLALARAYLVLQGLDGVPQRAAYREKLLAMARYFQRHLKPQLDGRAYLWNYWDPPAGQDDIRRSPEDFSHATIDVGFLVEAAQSGVVFTADDAVRVARTYTDVMSNGDTKAPRLSHNVTGQGPKKDGLAWDWALLGLYDAAAFRQAVAMAGGSATNWPQLVEVVARLGGVNEADRAACRQRSERLRAVLGAARDGNLGFEAGLSDLPLGWACQRWSEAVGDGRFEWSTEAHEGRRSLALIGTAGRPNLVAECHRRWSPAQPTSYRVTVYYRTRGEAKPYLSYVAALPGGQQQYDSSPFLTAQASWTKATWQFRTTAGSADGRLFLRNAGVGTVWYDAVEVTAVP